MWLFVPTTSTLSASAQVAAGSISASNWQCQMLARSCSWRGKPSQPDTWSARCKKVSWLQRLYGAMSPHSTASLGVAQWTASLVASRANPIVSPGSAKDLTTNATSGQMPGASSSRRDRGSSSSKTSVACYRRSPASIRAHYGSGVTYADWVSALRLDCSQRQKSARVTSANASSSSQWRTPTDDSTRGGPQSGAKRLEGGHTMNLQDQVQDFGRWPTPDANVMNDGEGPETFFARQARVKAKGINGNGMGMPLTIAATTWPTPAARDWKGSNQEEKHDRGSKGPPLNEMAVLWPTPTSLSFGDSHQPGNSRSYNLTMESARAIYSRLAHPIYEVGGISSKERRSLNPLFVEWLMGWPPGWTLLAWTDLGCSATALSAYKLRMRSALWSLGLPQPALPARLDLFATFGMAT